MKLREGFVNSRMADTTYVAKSVCSNLFADKHWGTTTM